LNDATTGVALATSTFDLDGVIGGGQIGYNVQTGNWVWGIEADLQASGQSGGKNLVCPGATGAAGPGTCAIGFFSTFLPAIPGGAVTDALSQKLTWLDTVRGRVGVTVTPTILAYVTGGLAVGNVSTTDTISGTNALAGGAPVVASFNSSSTRAGWTIGGGLETALGGRWTGKIEYIYVDLGTVSGGPFVTPLVAPSGNFLSGSFSSHVTDNILRAGVNYRF
jgi:outer membrane immunogenic protein